MQSFLSALASNPKQLGHARDCVDLPKRGVAHVASRSQGRGCLPITCCAKRFAEQASSLFSCAHLHLSKTAAGLPYLWLAIAL